MRVASEQARGAKYSSMTDPPVCFCTVRYNIGDRQGIFCNMVHKKPAARAAPRPRGRPRAYDADAALTQAMTAFWQLGYSATSLEQLSDATDMNRPSLYAAFGDKRALYLQTLDSYTER